jgi:Raf kinase inhibitor-like YbhB/YbcL family protein
MKDLIVESPAFEKAKQMPSKYTCDGTNVSPPLTVANIPEKAKTLVIIMEDPDAPAGLFIHWVAWNIPPVGEIKEGQPGGSVGLNDFGKRGYGGPCPPSGTHRYFFKVYALDVTLNLGALAEKLDLETAMQSHVLAQGALMGLYHRNR